MVVAGVAEDEDYYSKVDGGERWIVVEAYCRCDCSFRYSEVVARVSLENCLDYLNQMH